MTAITSSVGPQAANEVHDVALVQLMLAKVASPRGGSYFQHGYTQKFGPDTGLAISAFQTDQGLSGTKAPGEKAGVVAPSSKTWAALSEAFSKGAGQLKTVRTWKGLAVAYLAMTPDALGAAEAALNKEPLNADFRKEVMSLIRKSYQESQLAWTLVPDTGGLRPFAAQKGVVSDASFGETIHNYGYAVDLTLRNLSWVDARNALHTTVLNAVDRGLQSLFFDGRDRISNTMMLYPTEKKNDRFHLQAFPDEPLDSVTSFMTLMHRVGPRKMNWQPRYKTPTDYLCDLGLGGALYYVGTAKDIWTLDPVHRISKSDLVAAIKAKIKSDPNFSLDKFLGRTGTKAAGPFKDEDIGDPELAAVQRILKAEFDAAAAKWKDWQPVNYPGKERREKNPNR